MERSPSLLCLCVNFCSSLNKKLHHLNVSLQCQNHKTLRVGTRSSVVYFDVENNPPCYVPGIDHTNGSICQHKR